VTDDKVKQASELITFFFALSDQVDGSNPTSQASRAVSPDPPKDPAEVAITTFVCLLATLPPRRPLSLPQKDLCALVDKGHAALDYRLTGSPPRDLAAVNRILDQVLFAVSQIYPGLPYSCIGRTRNLNRRLTEKLLGGCVTALLPFYIEHEEDSFHIESVPARSNSSRSL
jgi:hypothetical protein